MSLRAIDSVWRTDTGRQRRDNEDSAFVRSPLYVVADGMGGAQAGEVASALAVEEFRRGLPDADAEHPTFAERLAARVRSANRRIYETAQTEREQSGMGTTLTAVYVDSAELAIAHVGDSRAYVLRDGELTRLTHDHSLVEELMRRGKLTPEQAAEHPQRSIITRALGVESEVEVDTWTYPARAGDVVLLCSDGLTSMIDEPLIATVLASTSELSDAAGRLIDEANRAGGRDNITVVLFRLEEVDGAGDAPAAIALGEPGPAEPLYVARDAESGESPTTAMAVASPVLPRPGAGAGSESPGRARLARTQGRPDAPPRGRGESLTFKLVAGLISTLIVLVLFGAAGYLATRELFFVGTNSDGIVTLYNGLPYDFIVRFWETSYTSGLPASEIPVAQRRALLDHKLRSQSATIALIREAELGKLPR